MAPRSEAAWLSGLDGPSSPIQDSEGAWIWPDEQPDYRMPADGPSVPFDDQTQLPLGWQEDADTTGVEVRHLGCTRPSVLRCVGLRVAAGIVRR